MPASAVVRARWIFPVASAPIAGGTLEVDAEGRIAAVGGGPGPPARDLGAVAILPGLVNAHTHLEFSELPRPLEPAHPFGAWIRALIAERRRRGEAAGAIARGLAESRQSGTVALGEIATQDAVDEGAFGRFGPAVVFRELIGRGANERDRELQTAGRFLDSRTSDSPHRVVRGLSPHAPYSVDPELFERLCDLAAQAGAPLAVHLAETRAELELLRDGTGELVDLFADLGVWLNQALPRGLRPLDYLRMLSKVDRVIVAHGNYLDAEEIAFVAGRPNFAVAYCPRTHAFFGHADHPWQKLLAQGGLVAIGTDGRCSNPDLSVWNELLFLRSRHPECDPALLLEMGTRNGARALGLESSIGTIEPGKAARLVVARPGVARPGGPIDGDPYAELFHPQTRIEPFVLPRD